MPLQHHLEAFRRDGVSRGHGEPRLREVAEVRALAAHESHVVEAERAEGDDVHVSRGS